MSAAPRVVVTGLSWMGGGIGSVATALEELIRGARDEILLTAYSLGSGGGGLVDILREKVEAGVGTRVVVNRIGSQPSAMREGWIRLAERYRHFDLRTFDAPTDAEDLHAKLLVVDRRRALVGSANISYRGLVSNHELGVIVGQSEAEQIARCIDKLRESAYCRRVAADRPPAEAL